MTDNSTMICTIAAEARQLAHDTTTAENDRRALCSDPAWKDDIAAVRKVRILDAFYLEACDRLDDLETFVARLEPQSLEDVLILAGLAGSLLQRPLDGEDCEQKKRRLKSILNGIVPVLERATGKNAEELGALAFGFEHTTWQRQADEARKLLESARTAKNAA